MAIDASRVAAALRVLAAAIEGIDEATGEAAPLPAAAPAPRRGRGRPVVGEAPAAPAANTAAGAPSTGGAAASAQTAPSAGAAGTSPSEADPFSTAPAAAPAPTATLDDVRAALIALKDATSQENALGVLKKMGGVDNITALDKGKYGAVVAAAQQAAKDAKQVVAAEPADPFGETAASAAPAEKPLTIEDVKAELVAASKKVSVDRAQAILMKHGGSAPNPQGGPALPALKALPQANYAACVAELRALPSTK